MVVKHAALHVLSCDLRLPDLGRAAAYKALEVLASLAIATITRWGTPLKPIRLHLFNIIKPQVGWASKLPNLYVFV